MSLDPVSARKYIFFAKKGRPTGAEAELLKAIKESIIGQGLNDNEIVSKFGVANDVESLQKMLDFIKMPAPSGKVISQPITNAVIETQKTTVQSNTNMSTQPQNATSQPDVPLHVVSDIPPIPEEPDMYREGVTHKSYYDEGKNPKQPLPQQPSQPQQPGSSGTPPPQPPPQPSPASSMSDIPETESGGAKPFSTQPNPEAQKLAEDTFKEEAKMYVLAYNELTNSIAKKYSRFPEKKIRKLTLDGDLDLNQEHDLQEGGKVSVRSFIDEHNMEVETTFVVDDDIKASMEKVATRLLIKYNVNAANSDERTGIGLVIIDLKAKAENVAKLHSKVSDCLDFFVSSHKEKMEELNPKKHSNVHETGDTGANKKSGSDNNEPINVNT